MADANGLAWMTDARDDTDLLQAVFEHELPPVLDDLMDDYLALDGARSRFMWQWVHRLAPENTLPCVHEECADSVPIDKTLTILYVTLLDDALEKRGDRATFHATAAIPFEHRATDRSRDDVDAEYVAFAERVWETLLDRLREAPQYATYEDVFLFDVKQAINAIEYSDLVIQRPNLAAVVELERYESHNMGMLAYADIDLMHSPPPVLTEFATLREAVWEAQQMARIGNWVSTWERELREGDFCTAVVVYAMENGIVTAAELRDIDAADEAAQDAIVARIRESEVEAVFLRRWAEHRDRLVEIGDDLSTMDLSPFVDSMDEVLRYHLASTGLK
jgi:hypothetical protein